MKRQISESEFTRNEAAHLRELAERIETVIEDFNLNCTYIARECNLDPRIVHRAKRCVRVNGECERRITYFIDTKYGDKRHKNE